MMKDITQTDVARLHRRLGAYFLSILVRSAESSDKKDTSRVAQLLDNFMEPVSYGSEKIVLLARLIRLKEEW